MIIDFHTHAFVPSIAQYALSQLAQNSGLLPRGQGTLETLIDIQTQHAVALSVVLNIATKPSQQTVVNDFAASIPSLTDKAIGFGSVHPDAPDALEELDRISALGLKGVKLHPDYQHFLVDRDKYLPLYEKISKLGLITVFHAGMDLGATDAYENTPQRLDHILDAFTTPVVAAHMAGADTKTTLAVLRPRPHLYLDTAHCYGRIRKSDALLLLAQHGADHILYGSDMPWSRPALEQHFVRAIAAGPKQQQAILQENARRLLRV